MSRSTRLSSAAYILSFVASRAPELVTSDTIARAVQDHPTRVRQLVSTLVKSALIDSIRGANGGVVLARPASEISLLDVYQAVEDQSFISMPEKGSYRGWGPDCKVHGMMTDLYADAETHFRKKLSETTIADLYTTEKVVQ